jgi:hypothetical protein
MPFNLERGQATLPTLQILMACVVLQIAEFLQGLFWLN